MKQQLHYTDQKGILPQRHTLIHKAALTEKHPVVLGVRPAPLLDGKAHGGWSFQTHSHWGLCTNSEELSSAWLTGSHWGKRADMRTAWVKGPDNCLHVTTELYEERKGQTTEASVCSCMISEF